MQSVVRRPRVFISSTINDFRDLRGALRYWLDQSGYDVQLSEYTDFERRPEDDVFEACFNNIRTADHYILLVGERRGSWYNEDEDVTVTRQEFRVAKEAETARATSITVFVRSKTDTVLRQWDEGGRPSGNFSAIQDPRFTADFLAEIRGPAPENVAARWTYSFEDFRDVIDGLRVVLRVDTNLERRLAQRNLLDEVLHNISLFVTKSTHDVIHSNYSFATRERDEVKILAQDVPGVTQVPAKILGRLGTLVFSKPRRQLRHRCLEDGISRGLFLMYDPNSQSLQPTLEHEALVALYDDMLGFEEYRGYRGFDDIDQYFIQVGRAANQGQLGSPQEVDSEKLALLVGLHDRMDDVFKGLVQMALWLVKSVDSPEISRRPLSPIEGMSEQTQAESVSLDELRWALENQIYPFGPTLTPGIREIARDAENSWLEQLRAKIPAEYMSDDQLRQLVSEAADRLTIEDFPGPRPVTRRAVLHD
jgi:hypothetical protein